MRKNIYVSLLLVLGQVLLLSCENAVVNDSSKNIYFDDISDVTFLNGSFYSTNNDQSLNSGSQIDLLRFEKNNQEVHLIDNFDTGMNGQGYLSITNDSLNLYLQSRRTYSISQFSVLGELLYISLDSIPYNWQPSGICYMNEKDSLLLLYKNMNSLTQYRARIVDKYHPYRNGFDAKFSFDFIDTISSGIYSIDYFNSSYFMLGVDSTGQDVLIRANDKFEVTAISTIDDSTVAGLCFEKNNLYLSYQDKRIEYWDSY